MKKFLSILLKVLSIILLLIVVLYLGVYFYIKSNKAHIIKQLTDRVGENLNGKLTIGDADISIFKRFPKVAVVLNEVSLTDSMYNQHKHTFFAAKEALINLNIFKLIKKEDALSGLILLNANIYFYTDTSGYTNTYLLEGKKDPSGGPKKTAKTINFKNLSTQLVLK